MANYVRTGPFNPGAGPGVSAVFLNNVENIFEQPSGGSESGHYFLAGAIYSNGAVISCYIPTLSRTSTPLSVTIDETDVGHQGGLNGAPATLQLTSGGFQAYSLNTSGPNVNGRCGGRWTVSY